MIWAPLMLAAFGSLDLAAAQPEAAAVAVPATPASDGLPLVGLSDEEVLARGVAAIEAIGTLKARFSQVAPSGAVSTGVVYLSRPGRLLFDYDAPDPQEIVATGGLVYVHDADLETTDSYPVKQTPLRYLLDRKIDLSGTDLARVQRAPGEVAVSLRSTDEELDGEVALAFAAAPDGSLDLVRWAVVDAQGGLTVVSLDEVERDVKLPRRLFRIPEAERAFGTDRR